MQRFRQHLANAHGGTRRGIYFVFVMRFNDFHVHLIAQRPRRPSNQLKQQIDPYTHVRRGENRNLVTVSF